VAKKRANELQVGIPQIPPGKGIGLLRAQIDKGNTLLGARPLKSDEYESWELVTRNALEKAFGCNSQNVSSITDVGRFGSFPMNAGETWWENRRAENLQTQIKKLTGLLEVLKVEAEMEKGDASIGFNGGYDVAQVCPNGHVANAMTRQEPERSKDFCERCGEKTITCCPNEACNAAIRGGHVDSLGVVGSYHSPPAFCRACGSPFPWTERATQAAIELATESGSLDDSEQQQFRESVEMAIRDTPKTQLAGSRIAHLLAKMGKATADAIRDVLVDVVSEAAKKMIWPRQ
jgi:hypothetical protein